MTDTPRREIVPFIALALFFQGCSLLVIGYYGSVMPYFDQWSAEGMQLFLPWLQGRLSWADMFRAFNEHHIVTTRLPDLLFLQLNHGIWNVLLQQVVNSIIHTATLVFFLYLLNQTCPPRWRLLFLSAAALLLAIPVGWENRLSSFQAQVYWVNLFSLIFIWRLAGAEPLSRRWWLALPWAGLGFLSQAPALVTLALGTLITASHVRLPERRRTALIAALLLLALTIISYRLTPVPDLTTRKLYQALSLPERLDALNIILSWPLILPWTGVVIYLPLFCLALKRLRYAPDKDSSWLLLCLGAWVVCQCVGIAFARGTDPLLSRYQDILVLGLPINFVCLLRWLHAEKQGGRIKRRYLAQVWLAVLAAGILVQLAVVPGALQQRLDQGTQQLLWIKKYLAADAAGKQLLGAAPRDSGYPDTASPVVFLNTPILLQILPEIVPGNNEHQAGWVRGLLAWLKPLGFLLTGAGLLLFVFGFRMSPESLPGSNRQP